MSESVEARRDDDPLLEPMTGVQAGDERALRGLYDRTYRRLFGMVLRILGERSAAEEVLVDVYTQLWQKAGAYDASKGSVLLWLSTIARRRAIDRLRSRHVRSERGIEVDDAEDFSAPGPTPFQASSNIESAWRVREAVRDLPDEQRITVEAAFFRGLSHTDVARVLDLPLGTVKSRIRAGLTSLRRALASDEEGAA